MDVILLQITSAIYFLATGSFIFHLVVAKDISSRLSLLLVFAGFLIHTAALGVPQEKIAQDNGKAHNGPEGCLFPTPPSCQPTVEQPPV